MKWARNTVSAAALLALAASGASAAAVTIEVFNATPTRGGDLYVSLANPTTSRYFAYGNDAVSFSGHLLFDAPQAFSLSTAPQTSVVDLTVVRNIAPGVDAELWINKREFSHAPTDGSFYSDPVDGLFESSPYLSVANGGSYGGVRMALSDDLRLRFGAASRSALGFNTRVPITPMPQDLLTSAGEGFSAQTISASLDWQFADWGGIAATVAQSNERGTILGRAIAGPLAVSNAAGTSSLGVSARVGFGDGWVTTAAFSQGITQLNLKPSWLMPGGNTVETQAYGLSLAKQGVFGDDMLGFSVSRPLQSNGAVFADSSFGPQAHISLTDMAGAHAPESDIQMGYVTTFLDGSLALQANAGYQVNAGGQQGKDAVTGVARAAIKF